MNQIISELTSQTENCFNPFGTLAKTKVNLQHKAAKLQRSPPTLLTLRQCDGVNKLKERAGLTIKADIFLSQFEHRVKTEGTKQRITFLSVQQLNKTKQKISSLHPNSQTSERTVFSFSHYLT